MDPNTSKIVMGTAGGSAAGPLYADDVFSTFIYDGNNGVQSINNGIDFAGEGGMLWVKARNNSFNENHTIVDTERPIKTGENGFPYLATNSTNGEAESGLTSFNSDGFTWGYGNNQYNGSLNYASWSFRNAPGFFEVVKFSGNNASGLRSVNHNLGSAPAFIIARSTGGSQWFAWHKDLTSKNYYLMLNSTNSQGNAGVQCWDATATTFSIHSGVVGNTTGTEYIAYLFADNDPKFGADEDESIIKCGIYQGNNSSTGALENLGFEPQWLMIINRNRNESRLIFDDKRGVFTGSTSEKSIEVQGAYAEQTQNLLQFHSTGFRPMGNDNKSNKSGDNYVYIAIRRSHKPPESATDVFALDTGGLTSPSPPQFTSNFPVDMLLQKPSISGGNNWKVRTRLLGLTKLTTNDVDEGEDDGNGYQDFGLDRNNGYENSNSVNADDLVYMFKRAPGFFDAIAYEGTGSNYTSINHGLTVIPEMFWIKRVNAGNSWAIYHKDCGAGFSLTFDDNDKNPGDVWQDTGVPTSTQFFTHNRAVTNASGGDYVGYFFATLPGVSKVGQYSGTGNAVNVNCGFTNGARFVLIKRTDITSTGDWYVWDTLRGIVSGNYDKYLRLNRNNEQVTNTNYVDPLITGFTVTSSAPAALNTSGGKYIFLAIA